MSSLPWPVHSSSVMKKSGKAPEADASASSTYAPILWTAPADSLLRAHAMHASMKPV